MTIKERAPPFINCMEMSLICGFFMEIVSAITQKKVFSELILTGGFKFPSLVRVACYARGAFDTPFVSKVTGWFFRYT